ncbi:MAG TPA: LacI family DNA-binding transcriptional regulator, partial [Noviherbaspirillum sp.]
MASRSGTKSPPTINDIADAAHVSKSTVSLVLKNSPLIKPETAAKVLHAANQLGYVYNRSAASLRQKTSNIVGLVIQDLKNPFFVELLVGAEKVLLESGYITFMA